MDPTQKPAPQPAQKPAVANSIKKQSSPNPEPPQTGERLTGTISCPIATQNQDIHLANRRKAIKKFGYGPVYPLNPNVKFWEDKVVKWNADSVDDAKSSKCSNCGHFKNDPKTEKCIEIGSKNQQVQESDATLVNVPDATWDRTDAGKKGYCALHKFVCDGSRVCDKWSSKIKR